MRNPWKLTSYIATKTRILQLELYSQYKSTHLKDVLGTDKNTQFIEPED